MLKGADHDIRRELEGMLESGIYFDGQPFVDFEDRQANWEFFSKGILSPNNTKMKEYISYIEHKRDEERKREQDAKRQAVKERKIHTYKQLHNVINSKGVSSQSL